MNFNAVHGCLRCTIKGKYYDEYGTVFFTTINHEFRTDKVFRLNGYEEHQKCTTPLADLQFDIIKDVVVADPLHLLELGVVKRLLSGWIHGDFKHSAKWDIKTKEAISAKLESIKFPVEIHRCSRSLKIFSLWKGFEFRNFLNYYGPIILIDNLKEKYYNHFLLL